MSDSANPGATLVAPVHAFDPAALAGYLRTHAGDAAADLAIEQFQGGQSNPTYRVTTAARRYILRRKPPGALLSLMRITSLITPNGTPRPPSRWFAGLFGSSVSM